MNDAKNVLGTPLQCCCTNPMTGYYRDGYCRVEGDYGVHAICCEVTAEFLAFSKSVGNDLSTPVPMYNFPGLKPGDRWCVCAARWVEALKAGVAPPIVLESTHARMLEYATLDELKKFAIDRS
jgi:uncharacterized protein (DUF2237 family)